MFSAYGRCFAPALFALTLLGSAHLALAQGKKDAKAPFAVKIVTDKPEAIYAKGEKAKFLVSVLDESQKPVAGKKVSLSIAKESSKPESLQVETKDAPVEIEGSMDRPGFILCSGTYEYEPGKKAAGFGGAGFDPLEIKPGRPAPEDFDAFWAAQKAELAKVPMNPSMTPVDPAGSLKGKVETFDIKVACPGGMPVSGYYSRPVGAAPKSLPAFVSLHGAGVRSSGRLDGRAAQGMLALDINAHGIENGKPPAFYDELSKGALSGYRLGSEDREKIYFKGMFLRVMRALEFIKSQPEWDGRTLVAWGSSQGGAQALAAAALDPQVTFCVALVPAMCNHNGEASGCNAGWPRFVRYVNGKPSNPAVADAAQYYDMVNFAPKIKAETFIGVGLIDTTCPPSSVYAAFNSLGCKKEIKNYPLMGHEYRAQDAEARLQSYLKEVKAEAK